MEKKKCSLPDHLENEAIKYCQECKIFMCNKCDKLHIELFKNHHPYNLGEDINEIFTGFCKEEKHNDELEFFCQSHNKLCCAACISKIKINGKGQHTDCNVCYIEDIKEEKKKILKNNISLLEELSITLKDSIEKLKNIILVINESKEELKIKIQKIFTKIRTVINNREDELLLEVDKKYENFYFNENIIKNGEKLPNKIQLSLEKGKNLENEWNNKNKLSSLINECIDIEKNIIEMKIIDENIKKYNNLEQLKIDFNPNEESEINRFLNNIKNFGALESAELNENFSFKKCPIFIEEKRRFEVNGEKNNILIKTAGNSTNYSGTICENELDKNKIHKWKIKILNTYEYKINIGVASIDFDINNPFPEKCGWYYYCYSGTLNSGPPHNYKYKKTNLKNKKDEIIVIMNMIERTIKFIIDNEDSQESYRNIPIDKPLFPSVILISENDSVEIIKEKIN